MTPRSVGLIKALNHLRRWDALGFVPTPLQRTAETMGFFSTTSHLHRPDGVATFDDAAKELWSRWSWRPTYAHLRIALTHGAQHFLAHALESAEFRVARDAHGRFAARHKLAQSHPAAVVPTAPQSGLRE